MSKISDQSASPQEADKAANLAIYEKYSDMVSGTMNINDGINIEFSKKSIKILTINWFHSSIRFDLAAYTKRNTKIAKVYCLDLINILFTVNR